MSPDWADRMPKPWAPAPRFPRGRRVGRPKAAGRGVDFAGGPGGWGWSAAAGSGVGTWGRVGQRWERRPAEEVRPAGRWTRCRLLLFLVPARRLVVPVLRLPECAGRVRPSRSCPPPGRAGRGARRRATRTCCAGRAVAMRRRMISSPSGDGTTASASARSARRSNSPYSSGEGHENCSSTIRSAAMPRAVWLFTAPLLMPIAWAISASDRSP